MPTIHNVILFILVSGIGITCGEYMEYKDILSHTPLAYNFLNGPFFKPKSVPLLRPDEANLNLIQVSEGFDVLRAIDGPVAVVMFLGRARSGKSFSLNHLLGLDQVFGFSVGHEMEPKTKGVQIWGQPIYVPSTRTTIVIMDTEGLGTAPPLYDKAMTLFSTLVSSQLVYHLSEYIYEHDVSRLYSIVQLAEAYEKQEMAGVELPTLTWIVQRAALLQQLPEREMLFDVFLQEKPNPFNREELAIFNDTVRVVKSAFPMHSLFLIPPALDSSNKWTNLVEIPKSDLSPSYLQKMEELKQLILGTKPKRLHNSSTPLTGSEIASFAWDLLPAVNKGEDFLGDIVLQSAARREIRDCTLDYMTSMKALELPLDEHELLIEHLQCVESAINSFEHRMIGQKNSYIRNSYQSLLRADLNTAFENIRLQNEVASSNNCSTFVSELILGLKSKRYQGSHAALDFDITEAFNTFSSNAKGPGKAKCLDLLKQRAQELKTQYALEHMPAQLVTIIVSAIVLAIVLALSAYFCWMFPVVANANHMFVVLASVALGVAMIAAWALVGDAPISPSTIIGIKNAAEWTISFSQINPLYAGCSLAIFCIALTAFWKNLSPSLFFTPERAAMKIKRQVRNTSKSVPILGLLPRVPNVTFLRKTAERLFNDPEWRQERPVVIVSCKKNLGATSAVIVSVFRKGKESTCKDLAQTAIEHCFPSGPPAMRMKTEVTEASGLACISVTIVANNFKVPEKIEELLNKLIRTSK